MSFLRSLISAPTPSIRTHHQVGNRSVPVDFSITPAEQSALDKADLGAFWGARVKKDAVARIGLGMWGKKGALEEVIMQSSDDELSFWRPNSNFLSSMAVSFIAPGLNTNPRTRTELVDYWTWMAKSATEGLGKGLDRHHPAGNTAPLRRSVGKALATAHAKTVTLDIRNHRGTPGLLSAQQISDYHHEVFASFGLPGTVYGGTPHALVPDFLELTVGAGMYAPGADPSS